MLLFVIRTSAAANPLVARLIDLAGAVHLIAAPAYVCVDKTRSARIPAVDLRISSLPFLKIFLVSEFLLFSFAGAAMASAPEPSPKEPAAAAADQFVHDKLALWQDRLHLQDWTIAVIVSHPGDLRRGTLGNVHWDAEKKTAKIRVLSPSDYHRTYKAALDDIEFTIVHELIHLELMPVTHNEENRSAGSRSAEEDAVNRIAASLLQLDRKK